MLKLGGSSDEKVIQLDETETQVYVALHRPKAICVNSKSSNRMQTIVFGILYLRELQWFDGRPWRVPRSSKQDSLLNNAQSLGWVEWSTCLEPFGYSGIYNLHNVAIRHWRFDSLAQLHSWMPQAWIQFWRSWYSSSSFRCSRFFHFFDRVSRLADRHVKLCLTPTMCRSKSDLWSSLTLYLSRWTCI